MKVSVYLPYNKTSERSGSDEGSASFSKILHSSSPQRRWHGPVDGGTRLQILAQSHLWLCFLIKLFRNSSSASVYMSGAELGLDGNFYFHLDCLEGFGEADSRDDLCLYSTSIFEVLDFVFSFNSSPRVHTSEMGGSQRGRLKLFTPQGTLEVTRISKKSFRSAAYPPYIANLPFAESCLGVDFPLD